MTSNPPFDELFQSVVEDDFFKTVCGDKIGSGLYRTVFTCNIDPSVVIKIEHCKNSFANIREYDVWSDLEGSKWRDWLAPCTYLSPNGKVLIQKKTSPIDKKRIPKSIPNFLDDTHSANWGLFNKKPVMHDYGNHAFIYRFPVKMMKKP